MIHLWIHLNFILKSYLIKLPSKIQFVIDDNYQFDKPNCCWAFNMFKYCKNKKCPKLHFCAKCSEEHPVVQCGSTPYWIKNRMQKYLYSLSHSKNSKSSSSKPSVNNDNRLLIMIITSDCLFVLI